MRSVGSFIPFLNEQEHPHPTSAPIIKIDIDKELFCKALEILQKSFGIRMGGVS